MTRPLLLALGILLFATACSTRYIGNTRIEDTEENRQILRLVEQYRRAVEDRDIDRLLSLVSDNYFEDPGTPGDPSDDYDKAGLRERLEASFARVVDHRLGIDVRKVEHDEARGRVNVDYAFTYRYRLDLRDGADAWREQIDVNRLVFQREADGWRILSGL